MLTLALGTASMAGCALADADLEPEQDLTNDAQPSRGWFRTLHGLIEYRYVERDGEFIVEGDMLFGPPLSEAERDGSFRGAALSPSNLWPNGEIDFVIEPGFSPAQQADIYAAIAHWEQMTPLRFTEQANGHLAFTPSPDPATCNSYVGRWENPIVPSIPQPINLGSWCGFGTIVHEIGHAAGLVHEHTRPDRDQYITLLEDLQDLPPLCQDNFEIPAGAVALGDYDYDSIMHYGPSSCAGYPMFERVDGQPFVHNTSGLSRGDREAIMELYRPELGYGFEPADRWNLQYSVSDGWLVADHPRMLADVTGEGRADLIGFHEDGVWVSKSSGSTFRKKKQWLVGAFGHGPAGGGWDAVRHPRVMVDLNGDDRMDIVGFAEDGVWVSEAEPGGFTTPHFAGAQYGAGVGAGGWDPARHIREVRDLDGDGDIELIGFGEDGVYVTTLHPTSLGADGLPHEYEILAPPTQWIAGFGAGLAGGAWLLGTHPRLLGDVDGDGDQDLVGLGHSAAVVAYHEGSQFTLASAYGDDFSAADHFTAMQGWSAWTPRVMADVNGDGRDDIVGFGAGGVVASVSRGDHFEAPQLWSDAYLPLAPAAIVDGRVTDVDGDGRADLLGFGATGTYVTLSDTWWDNPTTQLGHPQMWSIDSAAPSGSFPAEHLRLLGDVDDDGMIDIVQIDDTQVNVVLSD